MLGTNIESTHCHQAFLVFPAPSQVRPQRRTLKSYTSSVGLIVAIEGGHDGQSCHSLSDVVACLAPLLPLNDHPVAEVVPGQRCLGLEQPQGPPQGPRRSS